MTSRVSLLRRICSLNMTEGADMEKHIFDLEELFDRLSCAGQALESSLKVAMVYRSLPESYGGLITAMESRPDADQTMELVKQKLLDEHQRRVERSGESGEKAMTIQGKRQYSEKVCYYCRKPGHFRRNCRLLRQQKESDEEASGSRQDGPRAKQAAETRNSICFVAGGIRRKGRWYVDSGCSSHMTSDKSFFHKMDENVKIEVVLADGSTTKSVGIGEGYVMCVDVAGKVREVLLKEVLYIPTLDSGLLSVRKLTQKGLSVRFEATKCEIIDQKGTVAAVAERRDNLYVLRLAEQAKLGREMKHLRNRQYEHRDPVEMERIKAENVGDGFDVQDLLMQMSDAVQYIKRYVTHVENRFGKAPSVISSNSGDEYASQEHEDFNELKRMQAKFSSAIDSVKKSSRIQEEPLSGAMQRSGQPKQEQQSGSGGEDEFYDRDDLRDDNGEEGNYHDGFSQRQ